MTDEARDQRIFKTFRDILGRGFTQGEVDRINAALYADIVAPVSPRMRVGAAGKAIMHKWEACKLKAYPDPGSGGKPWTIGWGSTTDEKGNPIVPGTVWTQERADARFEQYIAEMEIGLNFLIGTSATTQNQFDAMASFAYNVGLDIDEDDKAEGLGDSSLLRLHKAGRYAEAKAQFAAWNKSNGRVMQGLINRRGDEAELYERA